MKENTDVLKSKKFNIPKNLRASCYHIYYCAYGSIKLLTFNDILVEGFMKLWLLVPTAQS